MITRMEETETMVREVFKRAERAGKLKRAKKLPYFDGFEQKDNVVKVDLKLNHLFAGMTINAFPQPPLGYVFTIKSDATLLEALKLLVTENFLSAPVQDVTQPKSADCLLRYPGLISISDIVTFLTSPLADTEQQGQEEAIDSFLDFLERTQSAETVTVGAFIENKRKKIKYGGLYPMYEGETTFLDALTSLGSYKHHRFIVFSEDKKEIRNIVTQGAMCRVLQRKLNAEFEDHTTYANVLKNTTLKNVGLGDPTDVVSVQHNQPTLDAFVKIGHHQFGGLPVVESFDNRDNFPKLLGNVSARDIRSVLSNPAESARMFEPVSKFLQDICGDEFKRPREVISCKEGESLGSVLEKVVGQNIHRVYLVNEKMGILRVITLSDLLGVLII